MTVPIFLVSIAAIFLIGAIGEVIFQRTNVPDVIWLILAGILIGPVAGLVTRTQLNVIAPYFAALTLVVVLFEGGTTLKLAELSQAAPRSAALALTGFLLSVAGIAFVSTIAAKLGLLPDGWSWLHGCMLGAILGGSSSIIIMPAMSRANLQPKLANLVNLESALTDAFCVVGTSAIIDVMRSGGTTGASGSALALARSFGIGVAVGGVVGIVWLLFLRLMRSNEHAYPVTLSALLILYVVIDRMGGSAALGILTVAIILGNAPGLSKKLGLKDEVELDTSVRGFHRQMAFIIKSFFFVFIGAMLGPPWSLIVMGVLLGGVLFVMRLPAVRVSLIGSGLSRDEQLIAEVSMPRGMAAGVLATLPVTAGIVATQGLPVMVFAAVFTTILIFAVGFPVAKQRLAESMPPQPVAAAPEFAGGVSVQAADVTLRMEAPAFPPDSDPPDGTQD